MIRALFRLLAMVALSVAVIAAVLDATRSIAAEAFVMTPVAVSWMGLSPATLEAFELAVTRNLPEFFWSGAIEPLLQVPGFAFFAGLALLLYILGRRPSRSAGRYVLEN
jgi:hypothetical protein